VILPALYAIVDPLQTGRDPLALAEAMLAAGARLLQLRLKGLGAGETYRVARRLRTLTREAGALLVVNDRPDVAAEPEPVQQAALEDALPARVALEVGRREDRDVEAGLAEAIGQEALVE